MYYAHKPSTVGWDPELAQNSSVTTKTSTEFVEFSSPSSSSEGGSLSSSIMLLRRREKFDPPFRFISMCFFRKILWKTCACHSCVGFSGQTEISAKGFVGIFRMKPIISRPYLDKDIEKVLQRKQHCTQDQQESPWCFKMGLLFAFTQMRILKPFTS